MNLKTKNLINVTISTVLISFIIGYLTLRNSDDILKNTLKQQVQMDAQKVNTHIEEAESRIKDSLERIANNRAILASLNLISYYEDKTNHNALVFNAQKLALQEEAERYFSQGSFYVLEFYDQEGMLVAKKPFNETLALEGIVVHNNNQAYFKSAHQISKLGSFEKIRQDSIGRVQKEYIDGQYKICKVLALYNNKKHVGYAKVTYYFGQEGLQKFQKTLTHPIVFTQELPKKDSENISALDESLGVFLEHKIDLAYHNEKRKELMVLIALSILMLTGMMFLIHVTFINKEVLGPLQKLQNTLQSMLQKKYKPIQIQNNDEIGKIFQASNKIFERFWDNYTHLESYQKSVDVANLVTKTDLKGNITYANTLFCKTSGYTQGEVLGRPHSIVRHPEMTSAVFKDLWRTIERGDIWRGVIKNRTKSGGFYWVDAVICPTYDVSNNIEGYISIRRDITELMTSKEELELRVNYDFLTGLKSRDKLHRDLVKTISPCLVIINIDRFSQINNFYGHSFGDKLLQKFSQLLQEILEKECIHQFNLYRNSGDEFVVLLEEFNKEMVVSNITKIVSNIEKTPLLFEEREINLNLSCGISFENSSTALLSADMALKLSKIEKKPLIVYSRENSLNKHYENNLLWTVKLKKAIEEDRVVPFFQPIVNNETQGYEKYEALVRIVEADGKVISPFFFLEVAKQTKQYLSLTKTMVNKSFEIFYDKEVEFSVNLTIEDITNDEIKTFLFAKLDECEDIAHRLVLEIVESESIKDYDAVMDFITIVKAKGCKIAIDDFGSGYSNFEYLIKLQADYIKIDGSLIKNIVVQKESKVVVSTIVSFAKQMGIRTIAEFVENEEIFNAVKELGVDYSQGYHFQAPQRIIRE